MIRVEATITVTTVIMLAMLSFGLLLQNNAFNAQLSNRRQMILAVELDRLQLETSLEFAKSGHRHQKIDQHDIMIERQKITIKIGSRYHNRDLLAVTSS